MLHLVSRSSLGMLYPTKGVGGCCQGQSDEGFVHGQLPDGGRNGKRRFLRELQLHGFRVRHRSQGLRLHASVERSEFLARARTPERLGAGEQSLVGQSRAKSTPRTCSPELVPIGEQRRGSIKGRFSRRKSRRNPSASRVAQRRGEEKCSGRWPPKQRDAANLAWLHSGVRSRRAFPAHRGSGRITRSSRAW